MVALKGAAAETFPSNPPADAFLTIIYGPDAGLVSERGKALAHALARHQEGEVHLFDCTETSPSVLFDAAQSASLFGGYPVLLLRGAGNGDVGTLEALRANCPDTPIVVMTGDLKPGTALRKLGEGKGAYALPCYRDDDRAIGSLIRETAAQYGLSVMPEATRMLADMLGSDRLASRNEIEKLCLFVAGRREITPSDVEAACGDTASFTLGDIADAVGLGDPASADVDLARARRENLAAQAVFGALRNHFLQLRQARVAIDDGATAETAMQKLRPRVFFKRERVFRTQLIRWPVAAIDTALDLIQQADLRSRREADLADALLSRLTFNLARLAQR